MPYTETVQPGDVEYLLNQAQEAIESITSGPTEPSPPGASQFKLETFSGVPASTETATLDLIRDVDLDLKIELGRTHMYLEDVLKLNKGSVVPLDKMAGDPVDIYVNGRLIARGEVLVMNDNFCVRVAELIAGEAAG
ncbi:MAG: flagellar motor switch protein FliN [Pirellulales bacterium]|nr:flagellar motor switch protein FliN [Pirellulales bacterium]